MAGLPINFAVPNENIGVSYDYFDLFRKIGYKVLNCCSMLDETSTEKYILNPDLSESYSISKGGENQSFNVKFDFKCPQKLTLLGNCFFSVPIVFTTSYDAGHTCTTTASVKINKVIGGTTTQIGTTISKSISSYVSNTSFDYNRFVGVVNLGNLILNKDDILELEISTTSPGNLLGISIMHDPKDRIPTGTAWTNIKTTKSTLTIPLRVDL